MTIKDNYDVVVIGAGPGGLAAAISAKKNGAEDVLIIERDLEPGGILLQCIHNGFGVEIFKQDLPGPSYAQRFINEALASGVEILLDTMVLDITPDRQHLYRQQQAAASSRSRPKRWCWPWAAANAPAPRCACPARARRASLPPGPPSAG